MIDGDRTVTLTESAWHLVLSILANAPWSTANPLIMTIGEQLRLQTPRPNGQAEAEETPPIRQ